MNHTKSWGTPFKSQNPILFLHGLPGIKTGQNQDLAQHVYEHTKRDCLIQFGEGLSQRPGTFSFTTEIKHKLQLLAELKGSEITLVGHSWGGLQALVLAQSQLASKIKSLILMSPLLGVMSRPEIDAILTTLQQEHPQIHLLERAQLLDDAAIYDHTFMETLIPKIPTHIHITFLQAQDDLITPPKRAKGLLPLFKNAPKYLELNCDHQFLVNRPLLFAEALKALT